MIAAVIYLVLTAGMLVAQRHEIPALWRSARETVAQTDAASREAKVPRR